MKIALDNSALERLIGGDNEVEVEIRNLVVQEFAKKHLKAVVNDPAFGHFLEAESRQMREAVQLQIEKHVAKKPAARYQNFEINPEILKQAALVAADHRNEILSTMSDLVTKHIEDIRTDLDSRIERIVDSKIRTITAEYVDSKIRERLSRLT